MEATTLSVGKSVLNGALRYAQSALAEEVALQLGVRRDQVFITNELEMMQAFLMAAHGEGDDHSRVVKVWVKQVRDVAYNVEDSLQDFAVRLGRQSWWRIHRTLLDRRHVAKQMKELRANVEDVSQRNMRYQLIKGSGSKPATAIAQSAIPRATMSGADEARWQRDEAKVDLIRLINKKGDDLRVIAVSGTSTGHPIETSFIKRVYEDRQIHKKFKCRAWISLMCPFNLTELLRSIIEQFHENFLQEAGQTEVSSEVQFLRKMGMTTDDDLALEFTRYVNEKSYLIVLHDIRTIKEWGRIKMCFPNNKKGSRIIVSAAQIGVASLCVGPVDAAPECKKLFVDQTLYVFYSKDSQEATDLVEAGSSSSVTALESDSSANRQRLIHKEMMLAALKESGLIGRDNEKSHIMKLIANEDSQQREVICLWGMGGLGKTTLIKHVYQSQEFIDKFEKRACVTIMRPFSPPDILNDIAKQFGYKDAEDLVAHLDMKKYLIVLDDLLSNAEWDAIIAYFPRMETASRIVITTRIKDIAKHCSKNSKHENVYELLSLGHKDAYDLFMNKVFGKITKLDEHYPELVEQANLILKKCGGLPLALVTIGGFLASQPKSVVEWRKLNEHISAELETNPELEAIKTILIKSYDGLPYHLKSCFLYMPIFPEDYVVRRRRLVHRWAAEGYSMEVRAKSTEEILDSYFIKLISRGMLLPSQRSVYSRERVDSCQVHDLIREIGISKSMEENLIFRMEEGCSSNRQSTARHLAINGNWIGDQSEYERTVDMSRVRSLTVFGKWRSFFLSDKMVLLRVLDLEDTKGLVDQHLKHIGRLLHLRYLSLRGCEHICHLPDSLGNMSQLETLDIRRTSIEMLPKTITKLQKLQYIHAGKKQRYSSTGRGLSDQCPLLVAGALLCVVCCLPQVCWCDRVTVQSTGVMVPRGIGKLKSLHTLSGVELASGDSVLQEIKGLTGLRKLGVVGMTEKNGLQFCSVISSLSRLESLSIMRSHDLDLIGNRLRLCLRDVASPPGLLPVHMLHGGYLDRLPSNLQSFKLHGAYVDTLPKWFMKLENLVKLELTLKAPSKVEQDGAMQVLGNLPNLSILHLDVKNFRGEVLCFQMEAFRNLGVLHYGIHGSGSGSGNAHQSFNVIRTGDEVQILIKFDLGAMAKLEQLVFDTSSRRGLIEFSGLEFLPSIKEVVAMDVGCEQRLRKHLALHPNKPILKLRMPQCMYH